MRGSTLRRAAAAGALAFLVAALPACAAFRRAPNQADVVTVRVSARQFAYEPAEIRVPKGARVRLLFTTEDVPHGLAIRGYEVSAVATPGKVTPIEFVADRPGRFLMYCTVFCGTGHPEHQGWLVVEEGR